MVLHGHGHIPVSPGQGTRVGGNAAQDGDAVPAILYLVAQPRACRPRWAAQTWQGLAWGAAAPAAPAQELCPAWQAPRGQALLWLRPEHPVAHTHRVR